MAAPLRVDPGELTSEELIEHLDAGRRVIIEVEVAGSTREVALRRRGDVYYCDTPTTLHHHETERGMRECLEGQGYVVPDEE